MNKNGTLNWLLLSSFGLLLMYFATAVHRDGPALDTLVSDATRAKAILAELNPENTPHPAGSTANAAIAERITQKLKATGLQVERQQTLQCSDLAPGCTKIDNVIATLPGSGAEQDTILLLAHYDSVPGSPGAADDLAGVAVLIATAEQLSKVADRRNRVVLLISDGEESGLRGVFAFAEKHNIAPDVSLVINLEARGAAGPSTLFETGPGNLALVRAVAEHASRPVGNSLIYEIYKRMPNDTDLSVWRDSQLPALNFAFSRGASLYHSSRDDLERLADNAIAHHYDNLSHLMLTLTSEPIRNYSATNDATFTDIFGLTMVSWPESWNLPVTLLLAALIGFAFFRCEGSAWLAAAGAIAMLLLSSFLHLALGWLLAFPLGVWPGAHPLDHPYPGPGNVALVGASMFITLLLASVARRWISANGLLTASWLMAALLGIASAVLLPGASYNLIIPVGAFAISALLETRLRGDRFPIVSAWIGWVAMSYIAIYLFNLLDVVAGFHLAYVRLLPFILLAVIAAPIAVLAMEQATTIKVPLGAVIAVTLAATVIAGLVPPYTPDRPRSLNVAYFQTLNAEPETDSAGDGRSETRSLWRAFSFGPPDVEFAAAAGFPAERKTFQRYGAATTKAYMRPAPDLGFNPPTFNVLSDDTINDERVIKGTIRAGRGGFLLGFTIGEHVNLKRVLADGVEIIPADSKRKVATFTGIGDMSLNVEIVVASTSEVSLAMFELSSFPDNEEGQHIISLRPENAASLHFGDHTEIQHHYSFQATTTAPNTQ